MANVFFSDVGNSDASSLYNHRQTIFIKKNLPTGVCQVLYKRITQARI